VWYTNLFINRIAGVVLTNQTLNLILTTKQQAIVSIQLSIVTCAMFIEKFVRYNAVALYLQLFFSLSSPGLRGHPYKIHKPQVRIDVRKYFFSFRIIDEWNNLPVALLNCVTIDTFKRKLDCHLKNRGYF